MWHYYNLAMKYVAHLDRQSWFFILLGVVVIGAFCMRGFGIRR